MRFVNNFSILVPTHNTPITLLQPIMNLILTRTLIFMTFLGSCVILGLLMSATAKDAWIVAEASYIPNALSPTSSTSRQIEDAKRSKYGNVKLGLIYYEKTLNSGYGLRQNKTRTQDVLETEVEFISYNVYVMICVALSVSFMASAAALISSIFGTLREKGEIFFTSLFNGVSLIGQISVMAGWNYQNLSYLKKNMILNIDKRNWTSSDLSGIGISFYFLLAASIATIINLVTLFVVRVLKRQRRASKNLDEKEGNSIMLY